MKFTLFFIFILSGKLLFAQQKLTVVKKFKSGLTIIANENGDFGLKLKEEILIQPEFANYYYNENLLHFDLSVNPTKSSQNIIYNITTKQKIFDETFHAELTDNQSLYFSTALDNSLTIYTQFGENVADNIDRFEYLFDDNLIIFKDSLSGVLSKESKLIYPIKYKEIESYNEFFKTYSFKKGTENFLLSPIENIAGFRKMNDYQYLSETELTIKEFLSILYYGIQNNSYNLNEMLPDLSLVEPKVKIVYEQFTKAVKTIEAGEENKVGEITSTFLNFNKKNIPSEISYSAIDLPIPYLQNSYDKKLLDFPVTGLSPQQVNNLMILIVGISEKEISGPYFNFRLPLSNEWETFTKSGLPEKMKENQLLDSINSEGCFLFIYKNLPDCESYKGYLKASMGSGTVPSLNLNPDFNGIYQLFGNVSEVTSDGLIKGSSFLDAAIQGKISNSTKFTQGRSDVGIRLMMEMTP